MQVKKNKTLLQYCLLRFEVHYKSKTLFELIYTCECGLIHLCLKKCWLLLRGLRGWSKNGLLWCIGRFWRWRLMYLCCDHWLHMSNLSCVLFAQPHSADVWGLALRDCAEYRKTELCLSYEFHKNAMLTDWNLSPVKLLFCSVLFLAAHSLVPSSTSLHNKLEVHLLFTCCTKKTNHIKSLEMEHNELIN